MTNITSEKKQVNYSNQKVFDFINDFNHFHALLPQDKIEDWKCTQDTCSFRIKGMADLGLKIDSAKPTEQIVMASHGKNPFSFTMTINISEKAEDQSEVYIDFEGDINSFMKMMVEKPLINFFNMLVNRLAELDLDELA